MKHKSFGKMQCPVARGLERIGDNAKDRQQFSDYTLRL